MKRRLIFPLSLSVFALAATACKKDEPPPQQPQPIQPGQPGGYQPPPGGGTGARPPATAAPPAGGPRSPMALPCSQPQGTCGFFKCDMNVGKCAMPCYSNNDCIQGSQCMGAGSPLAQCTPAMPGAAPPAQ